jgi:hypothetical protein
VRVVRALRAALAAYEACAVDVVRAFRGSWFVGIVLGLYYLSAFLLGLLLGATIYDFIEPVIEIVALLIRTPGDIAFECLILALLLYAASSLFCMLARLIVQGITYLCFEMRGDALFYFLVVALLVCVIVLIASAFFPPILSEDALITAAGLAAVGILFIGVLVGWLYVRYRWAANPSGHKFDRDIGLAWSHMSDPRRSKFAFDRG